MPIQFCIIKEDLWQERKNNSQKEEENIFVPKTCNWGLIYGLLIIIVNIFIMIKFCIHTIEFDCTILNDFLIRVMTLKKKGEYTNLQRFIYLFFC